MARYKIDKKEAVEGIIEENLFSQPFMVELFGTDIEYELDHDTSPDTDDARDPILKKHILVDIKASKQTVELVEAIFDDFQISVKNWLKEYDLVPYFDSIYTSEGGVTISIDIPEQEDSWSPEKHAAKGLEVDGSYIPRVIMGALDKLKNAQDLPARVLQEMSDKLVDEIRGAGADNINESYVFVDFLEKLAGEVRNTIKGETIDHIRTSNDNTGLGTTLTVVDTPVIQYSEDKTYADLERQMKVIKMAVDARAKTIKKEVHEAIEAGTDSPISFVMSSAIRPKPTTAEDGEEIGKKKVAFYSWGKYQGEEEIDAKDLTTMVKLGQYELEGFDIRDEDIDKTFYARELDIDDTNVEEEGYGVKRAYAVELVEEKAEAGKRINRSKADIEKLAKENIYGLDVDGITELLDYGSVEVDDGLLMNGEEVHIADGVSYQYEQADEGIETDYATLEDMLMGRNPVNVWEYDEDYTEPHNPDGIWSRNEKGETRPMKNGGMAKNGKKVKSKSKFCVKGNYENIKSVSEVKKIVGSKVWEKFSNGDDERWNSFFANDNGVVSIDIEDDGVYVSAKSTQKHSDDESSLQTYLAEEISNFCGIKWENTAADGKDTKDLFNEAKKRFPKTIEKLVDDNNKNVSSGYPEYKANFENALFKKYGVMIGDTGIEDSSIKEAFDKNENVDNLVNYLGEKHQLTPVAANGTAVETKSPAKPKSVTAKSYLCVIKDRYGKEIGSYEVDYADDEYVDTFLAAIGVRLKAGDKKEVVEM